MKYHIKTYGCQMNYSDSERIAGVLELARYEKALSENKADLVVLNVCSVRKSAVDRIAGNFKKYKKYKAKNPNFKTVITGCVLESDRERFEKLFDLVIDIREIERLPSRLKLLLKNKNSPVSKAPQPPLSGRLSSSSDKEKSGEILNNTKPEENQKSQQVDYFHIQPRHQSKITAYVPIMTGCDNFCSYCVVPYTRGREYSRPAKEIINEVSDLIKKGYKEIILLGQNVNSYKSQISNPKSQTNSKFKIPNSSIVTFPDLLKLINAIPGNFWIRFLTSHPKDMTEKLIKTVAECDKCAEYIHLALQSGDDEILKAMNRKYTAKHYLRLIKLIRKYIPDAAISTDIIVGFPGEIKERFLHTAEVMKKAKFDMAYLNKYSPRAGTASAKLADDVSWKEKKRREDFLNKILRKTALENNQKYIGKIVEVLIDESGIKNNELGIFYGRTRSFKNVKITTGSIVLSEPWSHNAEKNKPQSTNAKRLHSLEARTMEPAGFIGQFVKIKIIRAGAWGLEGKIAK